MKKPKVVLLFSALIVLILAAIIFAVVHYGSRKDESTDGSTQIDKDITLDLMYISDTMFCDQAKNIDYYNDTSVFDYSELHAGDIIRVHCDFKIEYYANIDASIEKIDRPDTNGKGIIDSEEENIIVPSIPIHLSAIQTSNTAVTLEWNEATDNGVVGYTIYRDDVVIGTTANINYTDSTAVLDNTYIYSVKAFDSTGNSLNTSDLVSITIGKILTPSVPINLLAAQESDTAVTLVWDTATDSGEAGYTIYRDDAIIGTTTNTNYTDNTAVLENTYTYSVRAYDNTGNLLNTSNFVSFTMQEIFDISELSIGYAFGDYQESVTQNVLLLTSYNGAIVTWSSSNQDIINISGEVTRPDTISQSVTLTALIEKDSQKEEISFELKVIRKTQNNEYVDVNKSVLTNLNNGVAPDIYVDNNNAVTFIGGKYTEAIVECPYDAIMSLNAVKTMFQINNPSEEFIYSSTDSTNIFNNYRLQQVYQGITVYGSELVVTTDLEGNVLYVGGDYQNSLSIDINPAIDEDAAISAAKSFCGGECEVIESDIVIYSDVEYPHLSWIITIEGYDEQGNICCEDIFVDAKTGIVIDSESLIRD